MKNKQKFIISLVGAVAFGLIATISVSRYLASARAQTQQLTSASNKLNELDMTVTNMRADIARLSTGDLSGKLDNIEGRMQNLSAQLNSLQQIISPKEAGEILTTARMKEEILARERFEGKLEERLKELRDNINKTNDRFDTMQFWLWGLLVTLPSATIAAMFFVLRKMIPEKDANPKEETSVPA
jgi:hypothetical protein